MDGRKALAEETSIELHRCVAERLRADPALVERARDRVRGWLREGTVSRPLAEAWSTLLARLVRVETPAGTGLCLEPHDLVVAKYVAGREKDRDYVRAAARHRLVDQATLLERLEHTPIDEERQPSPNRRELRSA